MWDMVIIGGGAAGLTAALYAARAGKRVLVLDKAGGGGQILDAPTIENYPAAPGISGAEFIRLLAKQAKDSGAEIKAENVTSVTPGAPCSVKTAKHEYLSAAVLLATGSEPRRLPFPNEQALRGNGVSYCALCDGRFYRGRKVAVVGGGNTALTEVLYLSGVTDHVYLVHRRDTFRGEEENVRRVLATGNITVLYDRIPVEAKTDNGKLSALCLRHTVSGEEETLAVSAVFGAIGRVPDTALYEPFALCENGFLVTDENMRVLGKDGCVLPGIYAAGDCRKKRVRQLTTAVSDGTIAAVDICEHN